VPRFLPERWTAPNGWTRRLGEGLLDLVFAPVCVACGGGIPAHGAPRVVCSLCWARAPLVPEPRCPRCGEPRSVGAPDPAACAVCATLPPGLRAVRSAYLMAGPAKRMVHALKYRGWEVAGEPMAARLVPVPLPDDVHAEAVLVVPVPVSAARRRQRGYNQAELLAIPYTRGTGRRHRPDLLVRIRTTETQTALHPDQRRANVARAFAVPRDRAPDLQREHVLVVDDVWTTGATACACAEALLDAGARAVSVITFARAPVNPREHPQSGTTAR
jgi:ComF family protein